MWRNSLANYYTGIRVALFGDPVFTIINLVGMAIGIAACMMILAYIRYETSFDAWLPAADRTYQVELVRDEGPMQSAPQAAAAALRQGFAGVENATGFSFSNAGAVRKDGIALQFDQFFDVDSNFLQVLDLPLIQGNRATALSQPRSALVSEAAARRLFGRTDVVGRVLTTIPFSGADTDYRITGVFADIPGNSHLKLDILTLRDSAASQNGLLTNWGFTSGYVYVRLKPGVDAAALDRDLPALLNRMVPPDQREGGRVDFGLRLVPVGDVNTGGITPGAMREPTTRSTLDAFAIVAAFLLLMACVNFTNLSTAKGSLRAREIGLRKTLGGTRRDLIALFVLESMTMAGTGGLLGMALAELALPWLDSLTGTNIPMHYFGADGLLVPLLLLVLIVGVVGGAYPAFFLSRYRPAEVMNPGKSPETPGSGRLRVGLVLLQFTIAIGLITCTGIVYGQTLFAMHSDPGYQPKGLLLLQGASRIHDRAAVETLIRELGGIDGVQSVSQTNMVPDPTSSVQGRVSRAGGLSPTSAQMTTVDGAFFRTFGLHLLAGRLVTEQREADIGPPLFGTPAPEIQTRINSQGLNVVIDELAVRQLGLGSPSQAVGQHLITPGGDGPQFNIVGVVNSARFSSMRFDRQPIFYWISPSHNFFLALRFDHVDGAAVDRRARQIWQHLNPDAPYISYFADQRLEAMYRADSVHARMFAVFSGLAILVSCLGLFGLAAFMTVRRTKEIGIRKVFGARTIDIMRLLVWQFTKPVVLANLIAAPIAWWAMRDWLNGFAERIDLGPAWFVAAGFIAIVIAVGTVAAHTFKVARASPILALRYE